MEWNFKLKGNLQRDADGDGAPNHHVEEASQHLPMLAFAPEAESVAQLVAWKEE
jgi:hypothetical protein